MLTYLRLLNKFNLIFFLTVIFSKSFAGDDVHTGQLSIRLNSQGIVYINSEFLTNESVEDLTLRTGSYTISYYCSDSPTWNKRGFKKTIVIQPNQKIIVEIPSTNLIYINSIPYGSKIVQENRELGNTPAFINENNIDFNKTLNLEKSGYNFLEFKPNRNQADYFFRLQPESVKKEITIASPALSNSQTSWFKEGFVVVSILSSWAAFYFKREADKNYSRYLKEGNPTKLNNYYDATQRFDTYSDVSIAISLTSLGTYMYFLIFD